MFIKLIKVIINYKICATKSFKKNNLIGKLAKPTKEKENALSYNLIFFFFLNNTKTVSVYNNILFQFIIVTRPA